MIKPIWLKESYVFSESHTQSDACEFMGKNSEKSLYLTILQCLQVWEREREWKKKNTYPSMGLEF